MPNEGGGKPPLFAQNFTEQLMSHQPTPTNMFDPSIDRKMNGTANPPTVITDYKRGSEKNMSIGGTDFVGGGSQYTVYPIGEQ